MISTKSFVWESHVRQQFFVVLERFYRQKKQNSAWFSIKYILKIINVYQDNVYHSKTLQTSDFISYAVTLLHCYGLRYLTKKCTESWASKLFVKRCNWLNLQGVVAQLLLRVLTLSYNKNPQLRTYIFRS